VVLRVPLFLASVARLGDTLVSIAPAAQEALERARGISSPGCQLFSALKCQEGAETPESWTFECKSADWADILMDGLQTAGCILQGLGQRYQLFDPVAKGSFGVVFRAGSLSSGAEVAVKLFTKEHEGSAGLVHPLMEFGILHSCSHPNILRSQGLFEVTEKDALECAGVQGSRTFAIVTEYLNGRTLLDEVRASDRARPLGEERTRTVMEQLLQAVAALHDAGFVHRDIKPDNIVLSGAGRDCIKLIDFGLAAREADEEAMRLKSGTPGFTAPEVIKRPLSYKADCFSCGVTMFILLTGKPPFPGRDHVEVLANNLRCRIGEQWLSAVSSSARDLAMGLLQKRPRNRLSAEEALAHPWFSEKGAVRAGPDLPLLMLHQAAGDPPLRSDCAALAQAAPRASGASAVRALLRQRAETAHGHILRSSMPSSSRRTCTGFGGESPAEQSACNRVKPLDCIDDQPR
jgi:serine/threonine protein kinase